MPQNLYLTPLLCRFSTTFTHADPTSNVFLTPAEILYSHTGLSDEHINRNRTLVSKKDHYIIECPTPDLSSLSLFDPSNPSNSDSIEFTECF